MIRSPVRRHHRLDVFVQVTLTLTDYLADNLVQTPMEPVQLTVGGRPVRACSDLPEVQRLAPFRVQLALKLGTLVAQQLLRYSKTAEEPV